MTEIGSQDWAVSKLRGVSHLLWEVPEAALAAYNAIPPIHRLPWNPRIIANVLNGYVIDEARRRFEGTRNSDFFDKNGTTYHLFNGLLTGQALSNKRQEQEQVPPVAPKPTANCQTISGHSPEIYCPAIHSVIPAPQPL